MQRRWKNIFGGEGRAWPSFILSQFPGSKPLGYITIIFRAGRKTSVRATFLHFREGTETQPCGWVTYKTRPRTQAPCTDPSLPQFPRAQQSASSTGSHFPILSLAVLPQGHRPLPLKTKEEEGQFCAKPLANMHLILTTHCELSNNSRLASEGTKAWRLRSHSWWVTELRLTSFIHLTPGPHSSPQHLLPPKATSLASYMDPCTYPLPTSSFLQSEAVGEDSWESLGLQGDPTSQP